MALPRQKWCLIISRKPFGYSSPTLCRMKRLRSNRQAAHLMVSGQILLSSSPKALTVKSLLVMYFLPAVVVNSNIWRLMLIADGKKARSLRCLRGGAFLLHKDARPYGQAPAHVAVSRYPSGGLLIPSFWDFLAEQASLSSQPLPALLCFPNFPR